MIYLDNAATSKPSALALKAFVEASELYFANSASPHKAGRESNRLVESSRSKILKAIHLENSHKCLFCSGATEANNLALKGIAFQYARRGKTITTDMGEHSSVKNACKELGERFGYNIVSLPLNEEGKVDPKELEKAMNNDVILVSILAVNNETGAINDVKKLGEIVHKFPKAYFHVDATQAIGKENFDYNAADLLSFSGHKFGAPKGTGALLYKKTIKFVPISNGGEQENGYRAGTVDVPGCYSLALAFEDVIKKLKEHRENASSLMEELEKGISSIEECSINSPEGHSPYILNFTLKKKKASVVVEALSQKEIYVSTHSACDISSNQGSPVLLAMGKSQEDAENALRVSFSYESKMEEVETFLVELKRILSEIKDR
ncbi:MAG: cysteine desulfurase family protein [Candidatus Enteromonas sp.]|nr:cysteine desulfurase family protein [Candidatus Enteromonas sp.]